MKYWFVFALLLSLNATYAAAYQCTVNGQLKFQSLPCNEGDQIVVQDRDQVIDIDDIHPSWLATPRHQPEAPTCLENHCSCSHGANDSLSPDDLRFVNILGNLANDWHKYRSRIDNSTRFESNEEYHAQELRKATEYSCEITLHQKVLEAVYNQKMSSITSAYEAAYRNFIDVKNRCNRPDIEGWTQDESARAYVECLNEVPSHAVSEIVNTKKQKEAVFRALESAL